MDEPEDRWELGSRGRVAGGDELVRAAKADGELRGDLARSHAGAEATGHLLRAVVTGGEAEQPGVARDPQAVVTRIDVERADDRRLAVGIQPWDRQRRAIGASLSLGAAAPEQEERDDAADREDHQRDRHGADRGGRRGRRPPVCGPRLLALWELGPTLARVAPCHRAPDAGARLAQPQDAGFCPTGS